MAVRCRFKVSSIEAYEWGSKVKMLAIVPSESADKEEAEKFFAATPAGSFEATIKNEVAAEQFQPGQEWYLTLEPVPVRPAPATVA